MRQPTAILIAAAALAGGCTLQPPPARPAPPVPSRFPVEASPAPSAARIGWRDFFADPELQALIEAALANNRDLRAAAARIDQSRAALRLRGGALAPQLSGSAGMAKLGVPDSLAPLLRSDTLTSYDGLLQASWEIDLFGQLRSLRAGALEQYLASSEARRGLAASLVAQVAAGYLSDREHAERLALARAALANRVRALGLLTRRFEAGSGSRMEVTQADTLRIQAEAEVQALELARAQNANALALLVGAPVDTARFTRGLEQIGLDQPIPAGLPSDLLANRPDIAVAEHQLRAAEADIGVARAAFFPSITLTGTAGTASRELDGLFGAGTGAWLFRPTLNLPIFTGGRLRANLQGSQAQRDERIAAYEKAIQAAFRDVADALAQRRWLADQLGTADRSVATLAERVRLADRRFASGRAAYLEVLDAERDRFAAEQRRVQIRRAWLASGVALYAALGGGFPETHRQGLLP